MARDKSRYRTYDAPAPSEDVLRLAFLPKSVSADGKPLPQREKLSENGYTLKPLSNGDCIVTVRHDGCCNVLIEGDDPQEMAEDDRLQYEGTWTTQESPDASGGKLHVAEAAGASASFEFTGNQVRLVGRADPHGGKADVYLDGVKQLCGIDFWCPQARHQQILCYKNGLTQGKHTLKIVALGAKNPRADGTRVYVDAVQWSAAQGEAGFGEGGGPADRSAGDLRLRRPQGLRRFAGPRLAARHGVRDAAASAAPISCRFPSGPSPSSKRWPTPTIPSCIATGSTGADFTAYFTVNPQSTYYARIKLCQPTAPSTPGQFATTIDIQGKTRGHGCRHCRHGRRTGQGGGPGLQRYSARARRHCHSLLASLLGRGDGPGDRDRCPACQIDTFSAFQVSTGPTVAARMGTSQRIRWPNCGRFAALSSDEDP